MGPRERQRGHDRRAAFGKTLKIGFVGVPGEHRGGIAQADALGLPLGDLFEPQGISAHIAPGEQRHDQIELGEVIGLGPASPFDLKSGRPKRLGVALDDVSPAAVKDLVARVGREDRNAHAHGIEKSIPWAKGSSRL
jgi:hypothetical protein